MQLYFDVQIWTHEYVLGSLTQLEKCVRRLRETFYGKIPIDKATLLMRRYFNDYQMVVKEIILMKDQGKRRKFDQLDLLNKHCTSLSHNPFHTLSSSLCISDTDLDENERWSLENDPVVKVRFRLVCFKILKEHNARNSFCMTECISCSLAERGRETAEWGKRKGKVSILII